MPQETITIKFKPDGHDKLIIALNNLAKAQKKVQNVVASAGGTVKRTTATTQKFSKIAAGLTTKLKAQGLSWKKLGVEANLVKRAYKGNQLAIEKLRVAMKQGHNGSRLLHNSFATLRSQLLLFTFAMSMGVRQLIDFVNQASKVDAMGRAFNTLSGGTENATVAMDKLKDATNGTMSQFDLFQQANNAMILGVSKNSNEMAEMFDIAQRLGNALGKDTKSSVESLITGIGRQSRLMLDNIGLIVDSEKAYKKYADELRTTADKLTDAQKKQAFLNATMESAREKVATLNDEIVNTQMRLERTSAAWEDAQVNLGNLAITVLNIDSNLNKLNSTLDNFNTVLSGSAKNNKDFNDIIQFTLQSIIALNPKLLMMAKMYGFNAEELQIFNEGVDDASTQVSELSVIVGEAIFPLNQLGTILANMNNQEFMLLPESDSESALDKKLTKLKESKAAQEEFNKAIRDNADAISLQTSQMSEEENVISRVNTVNAEWKAELDGLQNKINAVIASEGEMILVENEHGQLISKMPDKLKELRVEYGELHGLMIEDLAIGQDLIAGSEEKINKIQEEIDKNAQLKESLREIAGVQDMMAKFEKPKTLEEQEKDILQNEINNVLLTEEEKETIREYFRGLRKERDLEEHEEGKARLQEFVDLSMQSFSAMTSALQNKVDTEMNLELKALEKTTAYKEADAENRKVMEEKVTDKHALERTRYAQFEKLSAIAEAGIATTLAIVKAIPNLPLQLLIGAMGAVQIAAIKATPIPTFQQGGLVGGRSHSQGGTMINAESGEFVMNRGAVESVGIENLNNMNQGGGGGGVTVNVSGNVMTEEYTTSHIIPAIKEGLRRGENLDHSHAGAFSSNVIWE